MNEPVSIHPEPHHGASAQTGSDASLLFRVERATGPLRRATRPTLLLRPERPDDLDGALCRSSAASRRRERPGWPFHPEHFDSDTSPHSTSRRHFLAGSLAALAASAIPSPAAELPRYRIAVCDWMILKRQKLGAFQLTKDIGADGVEVDMGSLGERETFENELAKPDVRDAFLAKARELNLGICSFAMSGFYAQSFAERPTVPRMVQDTVDTMVAMGVKVAFLPLGVRGDLVKLPELRPAIVARLKAAGAQAEKAGVVIGVETALAAKEEVKLLEDIGSPAIRSYFNFANALQNGRDLLGELRTLGRERICQIHCTDEDGVWLEENKRLDMPAVKRVLDDMGWRGWLVIERSRSAKNSRDVKGNFGANARYLKKIFQGA